MLKDFYKLVDHIEEGPRCIFHIELNKDHPVYAGHFPGVPIAPGVMLTQTIKELVEETIIAGKTSKNGKNGKNGKDEDKPEKKAAAKRKPMIKVKAE